MKNFRSPNIVLPNNLGMIDEASPTWETLPRIDPSPALTAMTVEEAGTKQIEQALFCSRAATGVSTDAIFLVMRSSLRYVEVNDAACIMLKYCRDELLDIGPLQVGMANAEQLDIFLNAVIAGDRNDQSFETQLRCKDGRLILVELHCHAQRCGADWLIVGAAREISERKLTNETMRESEQRIHAIIANTPGMAFQCILQFGTGTFLLTHASEGSFALFGLQPDEIYGNGERLLEQLYEQDKETFYFSLRQSADSMKVWNWEGRTLSGTGQEKWINCRATPRLSISGNVIWEGVMLDITEGKQNEQALIESGLILRRLSAYAEQVREEERKRVAREVHDEIGQALSVLRMELSMLRMNFAGQNDQLTDKFQSMTHRVDRTIKITRHITSSLRPVALDLGLVAGLEWLVEEFVKHAGIKCQLNLNGCDETIFKDHSATALFRIVQESLSNVAKHAQATEVNVSLAIKGSKSILIEIHDNGKGFLANIAKAGSFGLIGMSERAMMLGGVLNIVSAPGEGTRVEVNIPLAH